MSQDFKPGDFLIFQLEAAYGLLRILEIEGSGEETVWHLTAYNEMFMDVEMADQALENEVSLTISRPHLALTNRAFESTQTARMLNKPLIDSELEAFKEWQESDREISDRSVRLLLGLR